VDRAARNSSLRTKLLRWACDTDCPLRPSFPIFPISVDKLCEYALWLNDNGVNGWASVKNYIAAAMAWQKERSLNDSRYASTQAEAFYDHFRSRFKSDVPVKRKREAKLAITTGLMEAMALLTNPNDKTAVGEMASYVVLYFASIRIGHVAPQSRNKQQHVLLWRNIIISEDEVFIYLFSTKTLPSAANDGWWTTIAARPLGHFMLDPVRLLRRWRTLSFVSHAQPVFHAVGAPMLVVTRLNFTSTLRRRLTAAARLLPHGRAFNAAAFAGISFRRSGLQALWGKVPAQQVADHAGHKQISSTMAYAAGANIEARRSGTHIIASAFAAGF